MSKTYDELKRAEYSRHCSSVIGTRLRIKGEISGREDLLVEGTFEGLIQLGDGMVTVGETGRITADIVAREAVIYGGVTGNVVARDRIEIKKEGSITGDLATTRIIIDEGANFRGSMEILSGDKPLHALPRPADSSGEEKHSQAFVATNGAL